MFDSTRSLARHFTPSTNQPITSRLSWACALWTDAIVHCVFTSYCICAWVDGCVQKISRAAEPVVGAWARETIFIKGERRKGFRQNLYSRFIKFTDQSLIKKFVSCRFACLIGIHKQFQELKRVLYKFQSGCTCKDNCKLLALGQIHTRCDNLSPEMAAS